MSHLGERLSALVDGELSLAQTERALAHLAACERCRREAVALRALKERMHTLGEAMAESGLNERLMAVASGGPAVGGARTGPARRPRRPSPRVAAVLIVVAAAVPTAGFLAGGGQRASGPRVNPAVDVFIQDPAPPAAPRVSTDTRTVHAAASPTTANHRRRRNLVPAGHHGPS